MTSAPTTTTTSSRPAPGTATTATRTTSPGTSRTAETEKTTTATTRRTRVRRPRYVCLGDHRKRLQPRNASAPRQDDHQGNSERATDHGHPGGLLANRVRGRNPLHREGDPRERRQSPRRPSVQ